MFAAKLKRCQLLLDKCQQSKKGSYVFHKLFEAQLNLTIREEFIEKFWLYFDSESAKGDRYSYLAFLEAVEFLNKSCTQIEKILSDVGHHTLKEKFFAALRTQILSLKPHHLDVHLTATYTRALKAFLIIDKAKDRDIMMRVDCESYNEEKDGDDFLDLDEDENNITDDSQVSLRSDTQDKSNRCLGCCQNRNECGCNSICDKFDKVNEFLRRFDLLEGLVGETVMNICKLLIEKRVTAKCKSNYSCSFVDELTSWVKNTIKRWALGVYGLDFSSDQTDKVQEKLDRFLRVAYAEVRVAHMFEIIIEYPNSEAAIDDLKMCLEQSISANFRLNLIESVKQSLIESLLHPGVNTYDILTAYISAIKALRALDPTGLILQLVTEPVRRYLKSRDDTVRCIVTALTDEDHNSELNREMIKSSSQTNENGIDGKSGTIELTIPNEGEKCTIVNFERWKPDPIKLNSTDDLMKSSRFSDIVSILVNIYETKDLFVEEYQKLLSQRLLNKYDECNLDSELRNLELLTLRFSDCELHRCEVMLKDVKTSKRINKRILSGDIRGHKLEEFRNLDVLIVSSPFWPDKFSPMASLSDEPPEIKFPPDIEAAINTYTKAFEAIQASRTLHWRHHLGTVNLDLTINGKTQNFTVSPLHASILYLFKEKNSWKLSELMRATSIPAATLRSRLALWQRNGLIRDSGDDEYDLIIE